MIVGVFGLGVCLLFVVWSAAGLAGLFAKGAWPDGVTFGRAPQAVRSLAGDPQDLAAAWPNTPAEQLSEYGLFWGLAIGLLMVLAVLTVFVVGTLARWKTVRAARKAERAAGARQVGSPEHEVPQHQHEVQARQEPQEPQAHHKTTPGGIPIQPSRDPHEPVSAPAHEPAANTPGPYPPQDAPSTADQALSAPVDSVDGVAGVDAHVASSAWSVPSPRRTPRVFFGDPTARRPAALQAVQDAAGPALVVTSDPTVWADTKDARAKFGPVLVYDPGHLCDTPARLHWNPTVRCEDVACAQERAVALLAPVRPHARIDAAMVDTAETLLRCWLHAAAVAGRPFKQVHRWAQGINAQESVRILRTHTKATSGLAGLLEAALTAHPERREIAQQLVARALSSLSSIHIREACTPNRNDALALESFINEGGTLYLVGEPIEDPKAHPGAMPLLTALASDVVEHGRRMAARSSAGRLDPPMTLVLDDAAAVAPLPRLPQLLTTGPDQGLSTFVLLRSMEQARARWQEPLPQ
ncbi:type VI secretion protein [Streptomyces sp. NPDC047315]|uniref:type VI secretion protein n=1 Tax=Streptomyces sp. NPDC047315 TaxID=3155142 RepID=UPI00340CF781